MMAKGNSINVGKYVANDREFVEVSYSSVNMVFSL